jgi:hypothetical protein
MAFDRAASFYRSVFDMLASAGVRSVHDAITMRATYTRIVGAGFHFLESSKYPIVLELFRSFDSAYEQLLEDFRSIDQPRLISGAMYGPLGWHNWRGADPIFDARANYSCVFPERVLFLCFQFLGWGESDVWPMPAVDLAAIPEDCLPALFALRPLLESGRALFLPRRIKYEPYGGDGWQRVGLYEAEREDGAVTIEYSRAAASVGKVVPLDALTLETPWLHGARVTDFIELAERYPDEFRLYSDLVAKHFAQTGPADDAAVASWLKELNSAATRLNVLFAMKRSELATKGVDVAMGAAVTVGVWLLPQIAAIAGPLASSKTAYDGIRWLQEFRATRDRLRSEDAWFVWRLVH